MSSVAEDVKAILATQFRVAFVEDHNTLGYLTLHSTYDHEAVAAAMMTKFNYVPLFSKETTVGELVADVEGYIDSHTGHKSADVQVNKQFDKEYQTIQQDLKNKSGILHRAQEALFGKKLESSHSISVADIPLPVDGTVVDDTKHYQLERALVQQVSGKIGVRVLNLQKSVKEARQVAEALEKELLELEELHRTLDLLGQGRFVLAVESDKEYQTIQQDLKNKGDSTNVN